MTSRAASSATPDLSLDEVARSTDLDAVVDWVSCTPSSDLDDGAVLDELSEAQQRLLLEALRTRFSDASVSASR